MFTRLVMRMLGMHHPRMTWQVRNAGKAVFLTFDDGPIAEVTPWVLRMLADHGAKATFFCSGSNAQLEPDLLHQIRKEGHVVGDHGWGHPDGWSISTRAFYRDVLRGHQWTKGNLFRPPYGRLRPGQATTLEKRYGLVMWDVIGGDYRKHMDGRVCAKKVLRLARPGSIILFHDNLKSAGCLRVALPLVLTGLRERGYHCRALDDSITSREHR